MQKIKRLLIARNCKFLNKFNSKSMKLHLFKKGTLTSRLLFIICLLYTKQGFLEYKSTKQKFER